MPRFGSHWLQLVRLASILAIAATTTRADRPVWAGTGSGGTGNANSSNNWLTSTGNSVVPSTSDIAIIDHGKATFSSNTSLGGIALTGNATTNTTGSIDGAATLTLLLSGTSGSTWDAGTINFTSSGSALVSSTASLTIQTGNSHVLFGGAIKNEGTTTWSGGTINGGNGASIVNDASGTFDATTDGTFAFDQGGSQPTFDNKGTFKKSGTTGGETTIAASFSNTGTVNVTAGRLTLHGGGTGNGTFSASGTGSDVVIDNGYTLTDGASIAGAVRLTGGTLTASGNISANGLSLEGGSFRGSQTLKGGSVTWSGGDWNSTDTTTVASDGTLNISGTSDHDLNARTLANNGTVNWSGGRLRSGNGGTLTNNATFNDSASSTVNNDLNFTGGTALVFTNASGAHYNKNAAGTTTYDVEFDNNGTVSVTSGRLTLHGGGTSGGTLTASGSGSDIVIDNNYALANGASVSGPVRATGGTLTANGTIVADGLSLEGATLAGNHTFSGGTVSWSSGNINASGTTAIDPTATLTISGTVDHDFNGRGIANNGTVNWTGGRLRSGTGGTFTNNGTFVDSASSDINNDYGGTAVIYTNAAGATYRKTAAGNTTVHVPFVNSGALDIQSGALVLDADSTFNSGSTMTGNGTLQQVGGVLTANGHVNFANLQIAGGSVAGTHTLGGAVEWAGGNFNNAGNTTVSGTLTIDGSGDHDFSAHNFENSGTVEWTAGAGRLRSGNGGKFQNDGVFNDSASSTWNNDYTNTAQFINGGTGTYNKRTAGTTTFSGVSFVNSGTVNVTAGSLDLEGGGSSPTGAHFNASAGSLLRFTGGNFSVADGSAFAGAGSFVIAGGNTSIGATVGTSDFQLVGGTLSGSQTFTGGLKWTGGNMNDGGSTTTVGNGGNLTIDTNVDHDFSGHGIVNNGTVNWNAGRLRSGNGGSIVNHGTFNDTSGSVLNNDYLNASVTFTNAAGGIYNKSGEANTDVMVPFNNSGTVNVSSGALVLHNGGAVGNGAAFYGHGTTQLVGGTFVFNGSVLSDSLVLNGATLGGTPVLHGLVTFENGLLGSGAAATVASDGVFEMTTSADHDLPGHVFVNDGTVNWRGGRIRGGNSATITNNGVFNDYASSEVNNDYLNTTLTFTNATSGVYNKLGAGTTTFTVPFTNHGTLNVSAGTMVFNGAFTNQGSLIFANGASAQFSGPLTFASTTLAGTGSIIAPAVTAGALVSPGNSPGTLTISGDFTMLTSAVLLIDLGGTTQGTSYDYLHVGGNVTLAGLLNLRFANGFESSILSSDTFTILSSAGTGGLTGAFANVSSGQRLLTMDGMGSFQVNYGAGLNSVTLSNFQAIPEPDTYTLMGMGLIALAVVMRRRRSRLRR